MKPIKAIAVALCTVASLNTAQAATRVMVGNRIIAAKDVVVGTNIYDVDFGDIIAPGWSYTAPAYPGAASPFATKEEATDAINAVFTQVLGDGHGSMPRGNIAVIGDYVGSPEQKHFGMYQLYGDMVDPNHASALLANFRTELAPPAEGGPWIPHAFLESVLDTGKTALPDGKYTQFYSFPVWTFKGTVSAVPEPDLSWLIAGGMLAVALTRRRSVN